MHIQKKLIVTVAINYGKEKLNVFIKSILENCPNCDILFLCDKKVSEDIKKHYPGFKNRFYFKRIDFFSYMRIKNQFFFKYISKIFIIIFRINNFFSSKKNINKNNLESFKPGKFTTLNSHFLLRRFIWYSHINIIRKYDYIYLTDCRDVFFQSDPFSNLSFKEKIIYSGSEPECIGDNVINKSWIKDAYFRNTKIYKKLKDKSIICAGVTLGSRDLILDYLERMKEEIVNYIELNKKNEIINLDQAFHNKIFSYDNLPGYRIDNQNKFISTIGYFNKFDLHVDRDNKRIIVDGKLPSVIHQYDRSNFLKDIIEEWYY